MKQSPKPEEGCLMSFSPKLYVLSKFDKYDLSMIGDIRIFKVLRVMTSSAPEKVHYGLILRRCICCLNLMTTAVTDNTKICQSQAATF